MRSRLTDENGMNIETSYCLSCLKSDRSLMRTIMPVIRRAPTLRQAAGYVQALVLRGEAPQVLYEFFFNRPPISSFEDVDWLALVRYFAERGSGCC